MFSAIQSSLSGVHAASRSLSARADNMANMRTTARAEEAARAPSRDDGVFRPYRVVNVAREGGGVDTAVEAIEPSHRVTYDPNDPNADVEGRVAAPNVNLEEELVGMSPDRQLFRATLAVIRAVDDMAGAFFDRRV